jgi:hypothetical protein
MCKENKNQNNPYDDVDDVEAAAAEHVEESGYAAGPGTDLSSDERISSDEGGDAEEENSDEIAEVSSSGSGVSASSTSVGVATSTSSFSVSSTSLSDPSATSLSGLDNIQSRSS